ncbi:FadR/GntR family transcriptional regulator [Actinocrinis sp.]|uniref:FadR/GntR family transcriptional regulator n=1 Tax=Actinocrinis sp. TaxID=1920516 RepID=UPI002D41EFB8|nr:FCD domain-containing protein [Actinocrinis sp.]HZP53933.1 FCD domain-containing protein [Actinocrinis sp.]
MTLAPVKRSPLVDQVMQRLLAEVASGAWPVGQRLPSETSLAGMLGVGRSTIREAIRALVGAGIVETRQGLGVFVASTRPVENLEQRLRRADVLEAYEVRGSLEVTAARLAAQRRTPEDLERLEAALERRMQARGASAQELVDADLDFHQAVVAAAWNSVLSDVYGALLPVLRTRLKDLAEDAAANADDRMRRADNAHRVLLDAIRSGDPHAAADAALDHLEGARRGVRAAMEERGSEQKP